MKCQICETESDKAIETVRGLSFCFECIKQISPNRDLLVEGSCTLCGSVIGRRKGLFKRRLISAALVTDKDLIICNDCLKLLNEIVIEEEKEHHLTNKSSGCCKPPR